MINVSFVYESNGEYNVTMNRDGLRHVMKALKNQATSLLSRGMYSDAYKMLRQIVDIENVLKEEDDDSVEG